MAALARRLAVGEQARAPLRACERPAEIPLSFAQRRLWFLDRLEGRQRDLHDPAGGCGCVVRSTSRRWRRRSVMLLGGTRACARSSRRRWGLRASRCLEPWQARLGLAVVGVSEGELPQALSAAAAGGFDLASEPPLRAHLFALGAHEHVLLLVLHHIAADGWSLAPLARDLGRCLSGAACRVRCAELAALPVQYADYTLWQHRVLGSEERCAERDCAPAVVLARAGWRVFPKGSSLRAGGCGLRWRAIAGERWGSAVGPLHAALLELSRARGASLFMVLQAGLAALLTRLGAGSDIPIGSPIAGRTDSALDDLDRVLRQHAGAAHGHVGQSELWRAGRRGCARAILAAYSHQELPFERLVEVLNPARSLARHPLFQVMLALQNNAAAAAGAFGTDGEL